MNNNRACGVPDGQLDLHFTASRYALQITGIVAGYSSGYVHFPVIDSDDVSAYKCTVNITDTNG
jgi:hypothetical protein